MSAERQRRPSAASARIDSQPYPAPDQRIQTIKAWVASLEDAPEPQLGHLVSNRVEPSPPPPPPPPPLLTIEAQYPNIPVLSVSSGWLEAGTDDTDHRFQGALADALRLPLLPPADYSNLSQDIRMKEPWERSTVTSTMHTVSMLDWNAEADAGSEFEVMSDWTTRPSRNVGELLKFPVPPPQERGQKEAKEEDKRGEGEEGSEYAPSSRSVTPPRKVLPRKARRDPTAMTTRRTAGLDEEYDEKDIDLDAALTGEASEPKPKKRRYVSSGTTAVEDHSARSSPRESRSPSPPPPPPPPTRRKGIYAVRWHGGLASDPLQISAPVTPAAPTLLETDH